MNNFTELFQMRRARPREEHAAWLTGDACKHHNKSVRAMAALCVGLQLYDTGTRYASPHLTGTPHHSLHAWGMWCADQQHAMVPARRLMVLSVAEHTGSCGSCHPGACQEQASVPVSSVRHAAAVLRHHDGRKRRHLEVLVFKCAASAGQKPPGGTRLGQR